MLTELWIVEDEADPADSVFGKTKEYTERRAALKYGYSHASDAMADGWINAAWKCEVPEVVAAALLNYQKM